jgi:hypothetical protein
MRSLKNSGVVALAIAAAIVGTAVAQDQPRSKARRPGGPGVPAA